MASPISDHESSIRCNGKHPRRPDQLCGQLLVKEGTIRCPRCGTHQLLTNLFSERSEMNFMIRVLRAVTPPFITSILRWACAPKQRNLTVHFGILTGTVEGILFSISGILIENSTNLVIAGIGFGIALLFALIKMIWLHPIISVKVENGLIHVSANEPISAKGQSGVYKYNNGHVLSFALPLPSAQDPPKDE